VGRGVSAESMGCGRSGLGLAMAQLPAPPPSLQEATKNSTVAWQEHLESLFHHAKDRFPDVVWELVGEDDADGHVYDEVWGHKGPFSLHALWPR
jgi:hypothetical protein